MANPNKNEKKFVTAGIHPELTDLKAELDRTVPPAPKLEDAPLPAPFDDKPVVKSFGIAKVKGGYCCVEIKSQGNSILESDIVSGPDPKPVALERLKIHIVRKLFLTGDVS
jgi:hypothetical protein